MKKLIEDAAKIDKIEKIIEILKRDSFKIIDNHTDKEEQLEAVLLLENGSVVQHFRATYQSLNRLYYSETDDRVHLSTWSIAGVTIGNYFSAYNKAEENKLYGKPNRIMKAYYKDGREVNLV